VYYIIVTFSTVGYGDMVSILAALFVEIYGLTWGAAQYPTTDLGRMLAVVLIVVMLVEVPIQIGKLSAFFEDDTQLDEVQRDLRALASDVRRQFGIPDSGSTAEGEARAPGYTTSELARRLGNRHARLLPKFCDILGIDATDDSHAKEAIVEALFGLAVVAPESNRARAGSLVQLGMHGAVHHAATLQSQAVRSAR
jgi:hypothetical protein